MTKNTVNQSAGTNSPPGDPPKLSERHRQKLYVESAIKDEVIEARGYRTVTRPSELAALGFSRTQQRVPALLLPIYGPDGTNGLNQIRPDDPRTRDSKTGGTSIVKYELPTGARMRIDCPQICQPMMGDPSIDLWITEGVPKGDSLASHGFCAVSLLGVWNFKGKNEFGGNAILADIDAIALNGRNVYIVFDSDVINKPGVRKALERLTEILGRRQAHVSPVYLPNNPDGSKVGVDDFLREKTADDLRNLISVPRQLPIVNPARVELLDEAPEVMHRPLQIIGEHAYVATWIHAKTTRNETADKDGNIVRHNPPIETIERQMFIIRDDGAIFGNGVDNEFIDLPFEIRLAEPLQDRVCMSKRAVVSFQTKQTRKLIDVFKDVADVFNRFLDFDGSLADQRTMCEMSACFALATWSLDAFNAAGYIYPTGGAGSGKTQFLSLMCQIAYLGEFVQASGSFASIRDLSNYGAFLGFDDAENVTSKNFDPDKRNILLSGTKRGSQIPLKEPDPSGRGWVTRYVNTFAFRGFSAIRSPDNTLGSRTITVPLIRTSNKSKGDSDPLEFDLWPRDPKDLRSDIWQNALKHLVEMRSCERRAKAAAALTGRNLEAWIGVLTVAMFIDSQSEDFGLFDRMSRLSVSYQGERPELEAADLTRLLLRAMVYCIDPKASEPFDLEEIISATATREWSLTTAEITAQTQEIIKNEDLDFDLETTNSRRVGRAVGKLRIRKESNGKKRGWDIQAANLEKHLKSYSLLKLTPVNNVSDVNNVNNVNASQEIYVSDVSYVTDVNKPTGEDENKPTISGVDSDSFPPVTNVSTVKEVNNVKSCIAPVIGNADGRAYILCECGQHAFVGRTCPKCKVLAVAA